MGHPAAGEQIPAPLLATPPTQGRVGAQQGHLQALREFLLQFRHHVALDEAAPGPQQLGDALQQGRSLQQLLRQGSVGGVVRIEEVEAPPGMGGGDARQQLQHRIHHQIGQGLAAHVHHPHSRIPQPHQSEELAFLVVMGSGHQGHLGPVHRQGGQHQHIQIRPLSTGWGDPFRPELLLEVSEAQGHRGRGAGSGPC